MAVVRVLLVEDHALVRAGIRALLEGLAGIQVVGEATNGRAALTLLKSLSPDVVLLDIAMPEMNGLEAAARIAKDYPHIHILILSMYATEEYVLQALRAGVAGYLLKSAGPAELAIAITAAAAGEVYLSPAISKHVIAQYVQRTGSAGSPFDRLTARQREILQLIAEGRTGKEIAETLHISIKTVETHRAQLMEQLGIHDIPGLVRYAIRNGLVSPDS